MTSTYSQDFRRKVHETIKEDIPAKIIASNFKIGIGTICRYIKHWKLGNTAPNKRRSYNSKVKLLTLQNSLAAFCEKVTLQKVVKFPKFLLPFY